MIRYAASANVALASFCISRRSRTIALRRIASARAMLMMELAECPGAKARNARSLMPPGMMPGSDVAGPLPIGHIGTVHRHAYAIVLVSVRKARGHRAGRAMTMLARWY
jgi:hypothetical protein